jgi:cellulose synthase/poly-beta-1,6-N-acetylglucosamine synthase-like glycosyltransferase
MIALFLTLALLCLALALHPFVTYPLSLRVLRDVRPRAIAGGVPPARVAVCVCAYNEAAVIAARADNILAQRNDFPDLDILFYVDAATDATAEILRGYGDGIRLVVSPVRQGKTAGMNMLVGMTDADIVVFSDANVLFAPDALRRLVAPFADPGVGCACGHLRYVQPGRKLTNATAATGSLYWRLEEHIKALESATGSVMGADGSIFAVRRALHRAPPPDLIDDMFVSLCVLCGGARIVHVADAVAYEEAVSAPAEEFRRKIRIACQAFNVNRALWRPLMRSGWTDRYKYVSHKLVRWFAIYLFGAAVFWAFLAVLMVGDMALTGAFASGLVAAISAIWLIDRGPVGKLREILGAMLGTGIGVLRSVRGERFQTWTPPASARRPLAAPVALAGE